MRFGYFLPYIRPELTKSHAQVYRDAVEQMERVEAAGFDVLWFPEHHFTAQYSSPDPLISVVDAARRTRRLRVGTSVIVTPFHNPLILAERVAFADHLTDGRLEIGFARGASKFEYARLALTDVEAAERQREALEILLGVWGADEPYAYEGRFYQFPSVYVVPRPLQEPHPPIWIAARTPDTLRYCIERGLGLHTTTLRAPMSATLATLATIDAILDDMGLADRPPLAVQREAFTSESPAEVMEAMALVRKNHIRGFNQSRQGQASLRGYGTLDPLPEGSELSVQDIADRSVVGDPATCVEKLRAYEALGADEFICSMDFGQPQKQLLRSIELFGEHVIPKFQGPAAGGRKGRADAADRAAAESRRQGLLQWGDRHLGEGWREWDAARWIEHFERIRPTPDRQSCYVFDISVTPQNARADAAGILEPTGRLMLIRDQACPKCARPVLALVCRWNGESGTQVRAEVARRLSELQWHTLHP
jgi:alkanesulfonate monooxygenase SsuD/methylene tetrahydromethanopterin reductase-like flavin-dependent oxidoreductase (luciferase family)